MKKSSLIIVGLVLALAFTGCTKGSSVSDAGNKPSQASSTSIETRVAAEQATTEESTTEKPRTEEPTTEEPTISEQGIEYNADAAKKTFEESDIPESIKSIFLSDGYFIGNQAIIKARFYKILKDDKMHDVEWDSYMAADLDGDGKKELFYTVLPKGCEEYSIVVFHEHSDGEVYIYYLDTDKIQVGKDGAVLMYDRTDGNDETGALLNMRFDKEEIFKTELARAEKKSGEIKYYIGEQEVGADKYNSYIEPFNLGAKWTKFIYRPEERDLRLFKESDIPDSIKSIFLSDGKFIDTMTKTEMKLPDYKLYDIIYSYDEHDRVVSETYDMDNWREVFAWQSYIAVDFDGDGKKELFYSVNNGFDGVIFREHTDGNVYAYRHKSLRVHIGENGDVVGSGGADLTAHSLARYSFTTERIISTEITYAEKQEDGGYKYYGEGREISLSEFESYMKLLSEGSLNWCIFEITPDSEENQTSVN